MKYLQHKVFTLHFLKLPMDQNLIYYTKEPNIYRLLAPRLKKQILALPNKSYHHTSDCPTPWPQHCTDPFLYLLSSLCTHYSYCGLKHAFLSLLASKMTSRYTSCLQNKLFLGSAAATVMQPK